MERPDDGNTMSPSIDWPLEVRARAVIVFFLVFFLYVWVFLQPTVEYYTDGTAFFLSGSFFRRFLDHPGGMAEYGAAFLAQLNYHDWLGALVFTALGLFLFLTAKPLRRGAATRKHNRTGCR